LRRFLANFFVFLVGVVIALGLMEGFLRIFYRPALQHRQMTEFDTVLGWRLLPGDYHIRRPESLVSHTIYINELGMRNPEIALVPEEGTRRAFLIGDSFTFGMLTATEDLMASIVEEELNARGEGTFEVVNAGAQGWGTSHQYLFMQRIHEKGFRADTYVLCFFVNDILDNLRLDYGRMVRQPLQPGFALDEEGNPYYAHAPEEKFATKGESLVRRKKGRFRLYLKDFIKIRAIGFLETRPGAVRFLQKLGISASLPRAPALVKGWYDDEIMDEGWPLTMALVSAVRDSVRERGGSLAVCAIPSPFQVYATYESILRQNFPDDPKVESFLNDPLKPQQLMTEFCQEQGIPLLDLEIVFRDERSGGSLYSPQDHHLSKRGHRVAGEAIAEFLRSL
jgi:hypothetical protein